MKTWAKSRPAPRLSAKAWAAVVAVRGEAASWAMSACSRASMRCRRLSTLPPAASRLPAAKPAIFVSGLGSGGGRSMRPGAGAAPDPLGVAGLDLALDRHGKLGEWPLGGEHMGDVAEGILVLVEPAIRGDVDAPARHVLAVVVAGGQPQHLDHAGRGRLVAVAG